MDLRDAVAEAVERSPLGDNDGKSGALLERVTLRDGRRVIVKRFDPAHDFVMRMIGDTRGREVEMWERGFFEDLPAEVGHCVLGGWHEDGAGVLVMRDLGDAVLGWDDRLDAGGCRRVLHGVVALHRAFQGRPPGDLTPLGLVVGIFQPERMRPYADVELVGLALRGWEHWPEVAPGEVGERVLGLALDPHPLVKSFESLDPTLLHGDLASVNMAFEGDGLTLIDWGVACAAPGPIDIGRFLAGCAHILDIGLDDFMAIYRDEAADLYDERATKLGLLGGLVWLGWNKALDIVEHPDPAVREREQVALGWWLDQARDAFEAGL